jgi:hypothetical protein
VEPKCVTSRHLAELIQNGLRYLFTKPRENEPPVRYSELGYLEIQDGVCITGALGLALIGKTRSPQAAVLLFQAALTETGDLAAYPATLGRLLDCDADVAKTVDEMDISLRSPVVIAQALLSRSNV